MAYDLVRFDDGEMFSLTNAQWGDVLHLTEMAGWKPLGTYFSTEEGDCDETWDSSYYSSHIALNKGQINEKTTYVHKQ
jgi:hypothetical protein